MMHEVGGGSRLRVAQDGRVVLPEVAAEDDASLEVAFAQTQPHARRAQDVARVAERQFDAGQHLERSPVAHGPDEPQRRLRVFLGVERLGPALAAVACPPAVRRVRRLAAASLRRPAAGCARGRDRPRSRNDRPAEAALVQQRQPAAVIDVRVAQDDRVDAGGVERKRLAIALVGSGAALDQPAVEQQPAAADVEDVTRAGDFTGRAEELQVHRRLRRSAGRPGLRLPAGPAVREAASRRP